MQRISKPQGYSVHRTLTKDKRSPLCQRQKSRCAKPLIRGLASARLNGRHLEDDSSTFEAFLSRYSGQLGEFTSINEPNATKPGVNGPSVLITEDEDDEAERDSLDQSPDTRFGLSHQVSRTSSSTNLPKNTAGFDLLALIPPSALAPYLPQSSLVVDLFDVYFLEVPSAKLMFDHQRVVSRYQKSTLPYQVLFAILALASLYCHESMRPSEDDRKAVALKEAHKQGRVWAEISSQMALTKADATSLTIVRTCEQLALYWIAIGERDRANCHADISYQVYRTLVKVNPRDEKAVNPNCAAWFHRYIADYQSNTNFKLIYPEFDSWTKGGTLLPAGAALGFTHPCGSNNQAASKNFLGTKYAVGIVALWREVMTLLQQSIHGVNIPDESLLELDSRLHSFYKSLPSVLKVENLMDFQLAGPAQDAKLCFATIHCANMICLHSFKVRHFGRLAESDDFNSRYSEQIIIEMARLGGELIHEHISNFSKNRRTPPMAGYCVFAIGSVHAHMNEFRDGPGWSEPWINGVSCLLLLEHLRSHWPVLGTLCQNLRKRFSYGDPNMLTIPTALLWQLAGYRSATTPSSTDQYTTGFFRIPYSSSFVHEMLGLTEESSPDPENQFPHSTSPESMYSDTLSGSNKNSPRSCGVLPPNQTMGMVGTDPPTFNFEANLLGIIESRLR